MTKQLLQKKEDNEYFFQILKNLIQLKFNLIYTSNFFISLKNIKNLSFLTQNKK